MPLKKTLAALAALAGLATPALAESQLLPSVSVLTQVTYETGTAPTFTDNFKVNRTLVYLKGQPNPLLGYYVMFNPAKRLSTPTFTTTNGKTTMTPRDESMLQDGYVILGTKDLFLTVGQQKTNLSEDAGTAYADLLLPNRPLFNSESSNFGFFRDIGALGTYKNAWGSLSLGVFNGEGAGLADKSEAKDINARLVLTPLKPLKIGVGKYTSATGTLKERNDLSLSWKQGNLDLLAEGINGADGTVQKSGWVVQSAYRVTPELMPVLRYEEWKPGNAVNENDSSVGLNWFFDKTEKNKLIFAYTFQDYATGADNHRFSILWQAML